MPQVTVGGSPVSVRWAEYLAAIMPKGTAVEYYDPFADEMMFVRYPARAAGIFVGSFYYDGVNARIDVAGKEVTVPMSSKGATIKRLKDHSRLTGPGIGGDGI